jgi:hypothetical protein
MLVHLLTSITNAVGIVYANGPVAKRINVYFPASDSNVPISLNIPNTTVSKGNYNVTVTWPVGSGPITIGLNPS